MCLFDAAYDSENGGELDIADDEPLNDEFAQAALEIIDIGGKGLRNFANTLLLERFDGKFLLSCTDDNPAPADAALFRRARRLPRLVGSGKGPGVAGHAFEPSGRSHQLPCTIRYAGARADSAAREYRTW